MPVAVVPIWIDRPFNKRLPDVSKNNTADQVWHKEYRTENIGSSESLCQRQSNRKCQHIDQNTGNKGKCHSQPERMAEGIVQQAVSE